MVECAVAPIVNLEGESGEGGIVDSRVVDMKSCLDELANPVARQGSGVDSFRVQIAVGRSSAEWECQ